MILASPRVSVHVPHPGRRGLAQLAYFLGAYLVYSVARWVFVGDMSVAQAHARGIVRFEGGVDIEASVQSALDWKPAAYLLSYVYIAAQLVVLPAGLIWLYWRARPVYRTLRNTVVATWLIAVPIHALYPVAPPRLVGIGITDTVSEQAHGALSGRSTAFFNPIAAVPSLHVGLAVALGIAIAAVVTSRWAKGLALLWGPVVAVTVVATGNHYVFDVVAGLLVTAAGYGVGRLPAYLRSGRPSHTRQFRRLLVIAR